MDSLEAVQKSHQERLDAVTRHVNAAGADASRGWARASALEKELTEQKIRNQNQIHMIELYRAEIKSDVAKITDLRNDLHIAHTRENAADKKIDAIKKLLDTCFGDNIIFGLASAIRTILNGGN